MIQLADKLFARLQAEIDAIPRPLLRALAPVLVEAQRETASALRTFLDTHERDATWTAAMYRNVLRDLTDAMEVLKHTAPELATALGRGTTTAGNLAVNHLLREAHDLAILHEAEISPIALHTAAILAKGRKLNPRQARLSRDYAADCSRDLRRQLAIGLIRQESVYQTSKRIAGKFGPTAEGMSEALKQRNMARAERLVRTEMNYAYNVQAQEGIRQAAAEDPDYCRIWSAASDRRVCPICGGLDGATAPVDKDFKWGYDHPPAHPNCRCSVGLWRKDWAGGPPQIVSQPEAAETPTPLSVPSAVSVPEALAVEVPEVVEVLEVEETSAAVSSRLVSAKGSATEKEAEAVQKELAKVPAGILKKLEEGKIKVIAVLDSVTDYAVSLRGVQPRGWPPGMTWDTVPGLYDGNTKEVLVAGNSLLRKHASYNLTIHESMHAYDDVGAKGKLMHDDPKFIAARKADFHKLDKYLTQAGVAGLEETFAETGAMFFEMPVAMKPYLPNLFKWWTQHVQGL